MKARTSTRILIALILVATMGVACADVTEEKAAELFQAQDWPAAAEAYDFLAAQDKDNGLYWFRLGQSYLAQQQHEKARKPFELALAHESDTFPQPPVILALARIHASAGENEAALEQLTALVDSGARPFLAVRNATEFSALRENPDFIAISNQLLACSTANHRAFDLWLGEWNVTSPNRPGWKAESSITRDNDGCSVHEHYRTQGGYTGRSINFYDGTKELWHQTWIDNQGGSIYLEGELKDGAMVLGNDTNRVTWSVQEDQRVRQHWETTADEGETWTTAFDGYYERKVSSAD